MPTGSEVLAANLPDFGVAAEEATHSAATRRALAPDDYCHDPVRTSQQHRMQLKHDMYRQGSYSTLPLDNQVPVAIQTTPRNGPVLERSAAHLHHPVPMRPIHVSHLMTSNPQGVQRMQSHQQPRPGPLLEIVPFQPVASFAHNSISSQSIRQPQTHQVHRLPFAIKNFPWPAHCDSMGQAVRSIHNQQGTQLQLSEADTVWQIEHETAAGNLTKRDAGTPAPSDTVVADGDINEQPEPVLTPPMVDHTKSMGYPSAWNPTLAHYTATKPRRLTLQQENSFPSLHEQHRKEQLLNDISVVRSIAVKKED